jgi:hypothetical protein
LIDSLDEKVRDKYDEVVEDEEKRGWTTYSPITVKPFVTAPMTVPVLNGCTTPLDFFHALLPLTFFDHVTERTNAYAEGRHALGKENTPPSLSTRAHAAEEAKLAWTPTTVVGFHALLRVSELVAVRVVDVSLASDPRRGLHVPPNLNAATGAARRTRVCIRLAVTKTGSNGRDTCLGRRKERRSEMLSL